MISNDKSVNCEINIGKDGSYIAYITDEDGKEWTIEDIRDITFYDENGNIIDVWKKEEKSNG